LILVPSDFPLGAEKGGQRIAVEVQTFAGPSPVADLQQALGQFTMYRLILAEQQPERTLFLAIPIGVYDGILSEELGVKVVSGTSLRMLVFDPAARKVLRWTS
jgi:hypothetical protein